MLQKIIKRKQNCFVKVSKNGNQYKCVFDIIYTCEEDVNLVETNVMAGCFATWHPQYMCGTPNLEIKEEVRYVIEVDEELISSEDEAYVSLFDESGKNLGVFPVIMEDAKGMVEITLSEVGEKLTIYQTDEDGNILVDTSDMNVSTIVVMFAVSIYLA